MGRHAELKQATALASDIAKAQLELQKEQRRLITQQEEEVKTQRADLKRKEGELKTELKRKEDKLKAEVKSKEDELRFKQEELNRKEYEVNVAHGVLTAREDNLVRHQADLERDVALWTVKEYNKMEEHHRRLKREVDAEKADLKKKSEQIEAERVFAAEALEKASYALKAARDTKDKAVEIARSTTSSSSAGFWLQAPVTPTLATGSDDAGVGVTGETPDEFDALIAELQTTVEEYEVDAFEAAMEEQERLEGAWAESASGSASVLEVKEDAADEEPGKKRHKKRGKNTTHGGRGLKWT